MKLITFVQEKLTEHLPANSLRRRFAKGVFWSVAAAVVSQGMRFLAFVIVARILGKTGFGELGMIRSTVGMFGVFAGFSLGLTAIKHVAEFRTSDPERAGRIIGLSGLFASVTGGLMALGLLIFAPWLAEHTINAPHLVGVLRIGALILFINALNGAQTGALAGFEAFKTIAYVNLFVGLISFPVLVCGAYFGGLTGAIWALAINLGVNWVLNHLALRREARRYSVPFSFRDCSRELSVLWKFSLPAVLASTLVGPVRWACNAMLVNQPDGYGEMGILTVALTFQVLLLFVSGMLNQPLLSMMSNAGAATSNRLTTVNILSSGIIGVISAVPLLSFPEVIELLYGKQYAGLQFRLSFALIMLSTCIILYKQGITRLLVAGGYMWWAFLSNLVWAVAVLASAVYSCRFGASGLAASFYFGYLINIILYVPLVVHFGLAKRKQLVSWPVFIIAMFLYGCAILPYLLPLLRFRLFGFFFLAGGLAVSVWRLFKTQLHEMT